ncbi:MAG: right-handed parallel beta-helix repeat-containing protein [bacterium]
MKKINKKVIILTVVIMLLAFCAILLINKKNSKKIVLEGGDHFFAENLVVKKGETLFIMPGARLNFEKNKLILVEGKIIAKGTKEKPIIFKSSGNYFWRGVKIKNSGAIPDPQEYWKWFMGEDAEKEKYFFEQIKNANVFTYCHFSDISNEENKLTYDSRWIGAIEAYDTSLLISNSVFNNINYLGGIVTRGSYSVIKENEFLSNQLHKQINSTNNSVSLIYKNKIAPGRKENQGCADGIWLVNSAAIIHENYIEGVADDGIQVNKSYAVIVKNSISQTFNDGIEADSDGNYIILNNKIDYAKDNGVLIDEASAIIMNNEIKNSDTGLTLRNGSTVLATSLVAENNNTGILIFDSIPCALNEKEFLKVKNDILNFPENIYCSRICPDNICLPDSVSLTGPELVEILESHYAKNEDGQYIYVYKENYVDNATKGIFQKRTDILSLNPLITDKIKEENPFCFGLNNSLFLENSEFTNNRIEKNIFNDFNAKIEEKLNNYQCKTKVQDYLCDFKDEKNVDALKNHLDSVLKKSSKL